jgi:hypothetical protein
MQNASMAEIVEFIFGIDANLGVEGSTRSVGIRHLPRHGLTRRKGADARYRDMFRPGEAQ